ncbi:MAG: NAD(P)-binding domain-containing protein, partial [Nanoarchaeota archaeon]|nr:NAD(P)-binding domain-containing protein [Nanoarchaeota archaeon]MBU1704475.1 NAD(P)-binding domain-containing protein [Nanoarchaeota archaeon]
MTKIGFIGSGNMAFALMKAVKPLSTKITASDVKKERLDYIKKEIGAEVTTDNSEVVKRSNIIFLAVKPQKMADVLEQIKGNLKDQIIISIAAGITMSFIKSKLNYNKVVRVMPNTPCLVGEMAAGFAIDYLSDKEVLLVEKILNSAGKAFLLKEKDLDAVTGLSGS